MRSEADLFRQENLPLLSQELLLSNAYDQVIGAQTIQWEGQELTPAQLAPIYLDADRERRERAWRLAAARQLQDRPALNELWGKLLQTRLKIAANAGLPDYRAYQWRNYLRFDYTPADCVQFHQAIEKVAVPVATRLYARRQARLGVETLRPWDLQVDPFNRPPLQPFQSISELESKSAAIFRQVDPAFHDYFELMRQGGTLDLDNRKGKAPGGYCIEFPHTRRPFIFINAVGIHDDVQTVLHEGGHAFHYYETWRLPYHQQYKVGTEFQEVASMGMEFLGAPYLATDQGGFYTTQDAARARIEHLESCILFWPYMAVVDAFQHWAYEQPAQASDPAECDAAWAALWQRFMPGIDWSGLDQEMVTGWQRKLHIFEVPFYYIEYGLAQLGAMQVWANSLLDRAGAAAAYRRALALGGTVPLPELYTAAGAHFAFDAATLQKAIDLAMRTIDELEEIAY